MAVAKGKIQPDGNYKYRCGQCGGSGQYAGRTCSHCYDLNLPKLLEEFELARGERYYAILKAILSLQGKAIIDEAKRISASNPSGKLVVIDLGYLCIKFGFGQRMKPLVEWLEEGQVIPYGSYERLHHRAPKVSVIIAEARLAHPELD